jgi:hypothetical protein
MSDCTSIDCCIAEDPYLGDYSGFSLVGGDYPGISEDPVYSGTTIDDCSSVDCCIATTPELGDFSGFSLVGGDYPGGSITGNPESTFIVDCPEGTNCEAGRYPYPVTIPEDTLQCLYCDGDPDEPILLSVPCGDTVLTDELPAGSTQIEINRAIFDLFRECGSLLTGGEPPNTAVIDTQFCNQEIDPVECDGLKFSSNPGGLLVWNSTTRYAKLPAGTHCSFEYENVEEADLAAQSYVTAQVAKFKSEGGQCGYWNTEQQRCPPDGPTAAANTFFSAVSQEQADQDAIDSLPNCYCNSTIEALGAWTVTKTGGGGTVTGSGSAGDLTMSATNAGGDGDSPPITTPPDFSCVATVTVTALTGSAGWELFIGSSSVGSGSTSQIIPVTFSFAGTNDITLRLLAGGGAGNSISVDLYIGPV